MNEEYVRHFSTKITEEIEKYATNEVFAESRYIFTIRKDKEEYGYCTHCKAEFKTDFLKHNSKHTCPNCSSKCKVKQSWRGHKSLRDEACFIYYEKSKVNPNVLIGKGYYAIRNYGGDYRDVYNQYSLEAVYIFDLSTNKSKMLKCTYWSPELSETCSIYNFNINSLARHPFYQSIDSLKKAITETNFKYCPYKKYMVNCNLLKFLDLYTRYPIIEQITKVGLQSLIEDYLCGKRISGVLNWRGKDIYKMLRINKKDLKDIRAAKTEVTSVFLKLYQLSKKDKSNLAPQEIKELEGIMGYGLNMFTRILSYSTMKKSYKYIKKQLEIIREDRYFNIISTWNDYINDCQKLNMDLTKDQVLFPKNIHIAHQNTIKQIKIKEDETLNKAINKRLKKLEEYSFESNGLFMRPAKDSLELIDEGKALSHCVGTYAKKYAEGRTNIFLIRNMIEPDKPFYTLEFFNNEMIQVRGKKNCKPTKDVEEFVKAFKEVKLTKNTKSKVRISA